jgi:8-oxo-dGTP diphosphatase
MSTSTVSNDTNGTMVIMPRITARVFVEHNNQYLYMLQTPERGGELSLPGGRVKNKEFIRKGLIREVLEETNLTVTKDNLQLIHTLHRKEENEIEIAFFFKAVLDNVDTLALNEPEKFCEFVWLPKEEIHKNIIKEFRAVLKSIQKDKIFSEYPKKKNLELVE